MKVVLVDPLIESAYPCPPLGLMYIAAVLEKEGLDVSIVEMRFLENPWARLEKILSGQGGGVVGVTATSYTFPDAIKVVKMAKAISEDFITIIGGVHVTFTSSETLMSIPEVDIVVIGEGERTMLELCKALKSNSGDIEKVRGIAYRKNGEIVRTSRRPFIRDLDALPLPARSLVSMEKYLKIEDTTPVMTSRGCPCRCIFCASRAMWGQNVRLRGPKSVVDEIECIVKNYGYNTISFTDDVFTINKGRTLKTCDLMKKRGLNIQWECSTRADLLTRDLLKRMKKTGCRAIFLGIESGNQETLNILNKGITLKQAEKAVRWMSDLGIEARLSFMLGCPGENRKMTLRTLEFAEKLVDLGAGSVCFSFVKPYPGTALAENPKKSNIIFIDRDWKKYGAPLTPVCETEKLNMKSLYFLALRASEVEHYLNGGLIFGESKDKES